MKKTIKAILGCLILASVSAGAASIVAKKTVENNSDRTVSLPQAMGADAIPAVKTSYAAGQYQMVDLTDAADQTVHAVVHIKSTVNSRTRIVQEYPDLLEQMFGMRPRQRMYETEPEYGYGSGVILSRDGYIVTNNHVIETADVIEVTLNDSRVFTATVIGQDANTDLALIKIDGNDFPFVRMGDSDALKLGEWVLAVGNPFNLTSSVTAGVVSAKSRKIGVYEGGESIESFIQTDAAINMGNSGGALVNAQGELVGINSALASPTGTYAGYGFAIPTTIVRKVVADLKEYGSVQRALLGITGRDLAEVRKIEENKDRDFGAVDGVYVTGVSDGSGALEAGIKKEDIITSVDGKKVHTMAELQELMAQHRPGDKVSVTLLRDKKEKTLKVELKNSRGNTDIIKKADMEILGAAFQEVPEQTRRMLNIAYGMQVSQVDKGLLKDVGIQRGFIILKINGAQIASLDDIEKVYQEACNSQDQVLFISGISQSGRRANYAVSLSKE